MRIALLATGIGATYLGLACLSIGPALVHHPTTATVTTQDARITAWSLGWTAYAISHGHNVLFTSWANAPYGVNLMANATVLPVGALLAPFTLAFGAVAGLNLAIVLSFFLSALAFFALVRALGFSTLAAFVGGLFFGFSPTLVAQASGHVNLTMAALLPVIFLTVYAIVVTQRRPPAVAGALLGLVCALQFFVSSEYLLSAVIMGAFAVALCMVLRPIEIRRRARYVLVATGTAAGVCGAVIAYPIFILFRGPQHIVGPILASPQANRSDLLAPVLPTHFFLVAPHALTAVSQSFAGTLTENGSYLGIPLLVALAVITVGLRKRLLVQVGAASIAVAFVLTLGSRLTVANHVTGIPLPEAIFGHLPVFDNLDPARFSIYIDLWAAVLLAAGLGELVVWLRRRGTMPRLVATVGAVAVAIPLLPAWPMPTATIAVPRYVTTAAVDAVPAHSLVITYPFPYSISDGTLLWQPASHFRFKQAGGYFVEPRPHSGRVGWYSPTWTQAYLDQIAEGTRVPESATVRKELAIEWRSWRPSAVIADASAPFFTYARTFLDWITHEEPSCSQGACVWFHPARNVADP